MNRYNRQLKLSEVGEGGQKKIKEARIAIVGAGGLGVPAALYLAGAGIGHIKIIDSDTIELNNLHRQVIYREKDIGRSKAEVLKERLSELNSDIQLKSINKRFSEDNGLDLLKDIDIVLDCSDNMETRYLINDACMLLDKILVSAAIYKYEGQLAVFNYRNGPSYRCLYKNPEDIAEIASCEDTGVLGTTAGLLGIMEANEVIKVILNWEGVISGKVLLTNIINYNNTVFDLKRNEENFELVRRQGLKSVLSERNTNSLLISLSDISEKLKAGKVVFLDVREMNEYPKIGSSSVKNFPMSQDNYKNIEYSPDTCIVAFCKSELRSTKVAQELRDIGVTDSYSLEGGIETMILSQKFKIIHETLLNA